MIVLGKPRASHSSAESVHMGHVADVETRKRVSFRNMRYLGRPARCPSSPFFGGGLPYYNRVQKKVGTLILTSVLEDLGRQGSKLETGKGASCWFPFKPTPEPTLKRHQPSVCRQAMLLASMMAETVGRRPEF